MDDLSFQASTSRGLTGFIRSLFPKRRAEKEGLILDDGRGYIESVASTKRDLENVQSLFNSVSDPDLIDYAIYEEYAVKLKLSYLIKKAKEKKIKSEYYTSF
jgi:hypothetical protein